MFCDRNHNKDSDECAGLCQTLSRLYGVQIAYASDHRNEQKIADGQQKTIFECERKVCS